jgi:lipopolysaccharide export system permease protein
MSVTTRYLYAQMTRPFVTTLIIALLVLVIERMLRILDLVIGWRGGVGLVMELLAYVVPHYMGFAIPLAFFLAACLTIGRMSRDGELDAYFAAGFGLYQLARPVFAAGVVLAAVTALLVGYAQPYARYAYNAAVHALTHTSVHFLLREDTFTTLGDTTFIVDRLTDGGRRFEGAFMHIQEDEDRATVTTARRGAIVTEGPLEALAFELEEGLTHTARGPETFDQGRAPPAISYRFGRFRTALEADQAEALQPRGGHRREWTLTELWRAGDVLPRGIDQSDIRSELHRRLVHIATVLALPLLAIPLGLARRRAARSSGVVVGLFILIVYNEAVNFGQSEVRDEAVSPWVGMWLPYAVLVLGGLALFYKGAFRLPGSKLGDRLGALGDAALARLQRLVPKRAHRL